MQKLSQFFDDFLATGEAALAADWITAWKTSGEAALAADLIMAGRTAVPAPPKDELRKP